MKDVEPWERPHIRKCVRVFLASGLAGAMAMIGLSAVFRGSWGIMALGLLFTPWLVSGIFLIPIAFHKGVEFQRQRQAE
jgi:hypothetical protein